MKMKTIVITLVLVALIFIGSTQSIPHAQTPDVTIPIIQVARAETSVGQDSQSVSDKNAFFTGIGWSSKKPEDVERYTKVKNALDAEWIETYDGTNGFTGSWHVFLAKIGWKTSKNGLGTTGNYDTVTGFSGGTRTAVTLLKQGKITANTLCLISPQVTSAKELKSLIEKGRVKKIVVYQSDSDIFTSSHFKSREGIEVRDFSGIKHGEWMDFVMDQIKEENISPELEIINPPESLVTPEVGQEVVGSKSAYQLECGRIHGKLAELNAKRDNIYGSFPEFSPYRGEEARIACWIYRMESHKQIKEIYEEAYYNEQKIILPKGTEELHNNFLKYLQCIVDCAEYQITETKLYSECDDRTAHRYYDKACAKSNEAYEYYDKLQMEIYNNTGLERPCSITVFHD